MDAVFSHTHTQNALEAGRAARIYGSAIACLPELDLLLHTDRHILMRAGTHCWQISGRMLHVDFMPVTSNSEEIELGKRGESFDHFESSPF